LTRFCLSILLCGLLGTLYIAAMHNNVASSWVLPIHFAGYKYTVHFNINLYSNIIFFSSILANFHTWYMRLKYQTDNLWDYFHFIQLNSISYFLFPFGTMAHIYTREDFAGYITWKKLVSKCAISWNAVLLCSSPPTQ